ncbi:LOW QUALITY PROTEIN: 3-deoxy-D-manno-octulosonic-acid transferase [Psychrobacter sp. JCM 18900]|nr:LOW QUALITY PROTEIN: 3-deoxy-D-manno-octulosonic-acid transferase [Psychrobacter sp. JCM 18900]
MPSSNTPSDHSANPIDSVLSSSRAVYETPLYYQSLIGLLKPLYRLQVWRRSHKNDNYQQEIDQRFGKQYPPRPVVNAGIDKGVIWCHAVSLGETNTVAPLLDMLLANGYQIWLTNTTQTGFARGASRFAEQIAQGQMSHSYVPVDSPAVIETFLTHVQPIAALFVETELWANILTKLSQHRIPSILVNGRLSASSFQSYQKIGAVSASMMKNLSLIIAQDSDSAKRFRQLGLVAPKFAQAHSGSMRPKLDDQAVEDNRIYNKKADLRAEFGIADRPVWVAASTHDGEEAAALSLQQQLLSQAALADTLLVIVPRHPERFDAVADLIQKNGLNMARRSDGDMIDADTQVYLADSMGELMTWYTLANVAFVGGSLVDIGGHNPVEPASVATPVLMGRCTQSCQSVIDKLAEVGALYQPYNDFYRPIESNNSSSSDAQMASDDQLKANKKILSENSLPEDAVSIYTQLATWLYNLPLAAQAGQAGEQMTIQQQAVLTRQFTMIEDAIELSTNQDNL